MKNKEKILNKRLGSYLKELREQKQISLNLFAYENDLTTATVSRIENGKVDTKFSNLVKYANALEIPTSKILEHLEINIGDE